MMKEQVTGSVRMAAPLRNSDAIALFVLSLVFLGMVAIVRPVGQFPINDDWVYALTVKALVERGSFELLDWSLATVLPQAYWAALWAKLFGFSFAVLRMSTIPLALLGLWSTYFLFRHFRQGWATALIGAVAIGTCPLYFTLANSFMSDVPFYFFFVASAYCMVKGLDEDRLGWLVAGTVLAMLAILNRKLGFVLPMGFIVAYLVGRPITMRRVAFALVPAVLGFMAHWAVHVWLASNGRVELAGPSVLKMVYWSISNGFLKWIGTVLSEALSVLFYVSAFALPVLVLISFGMRKNSGIRWFQVAVGGALLVLPFMVWQKTMPVAGNVLMKHGVGPLTLRDTHLLKLNLPDPGPFAQAYWGLATLSAVAGAAIMLVSVYKLVVSLLGRRCDEKVEARSRGAVFVLATLAAYTGIIVTLSAGFFDRYILPCMPLLLAAVFAGAGSTICPKRIHGVVSIVLLLPSVMFSLFAERDFLAWNEARWRAVTELQQRGIEAERIDGGFEFNGWFLSKPGGPQRGGQKSWWWVRDDEYVVTSGPMPGYVEVAQYDYSTWMRNAPGRVYVLRRE